MADSESTVRKVGVKFSPPAIVLTYSSQGKSIHRRTIPLRDISRASDVDKLCHELKTAPKHIKLMQHISQHQLLKMLTLLKDNLNGISLNESLSKIKTLEKIDPEEDLNKVDPETVKWKKAAMDETFQQNLKKPGDPDFQYDIEVDFPVNDAVETLNWSDDEYDFGS